MTIVLQLADGRTAAPIEGPRPREWCAPPRTTRTTKLALEQAESRSVFEALDTEEKLIGENNLRPIAFLEQALRVAEAVALVEVAGRGSATAFLITPEIALTNNHVLRTYEDAARSRLRFNYQLDASGRLRQSEYFACRPDRLFYTSVELDFSLVAVENAPGARYGMIPIVADSVIDVGAPVGIVQHPLGQPKQIAIVDNEVAYVDDVIAQYLTDTLPGSSGSPVFNESWELVALHHSGGWIPETGGNSTHFRNEGIRVTAIVNDLLRSGLAS